MSKLPIFREHYFKQKKNLFEATRTNYSLVNIISDIKFKFKLEKKNLKDLLSLNSNHLKTSNHTQKNLYLISKKPYPTICLKTQK